MLSLFQCDKKDEEAVVDLFAAEIQKCLSNLNFHVIKRKRDVNSKSV